MRSNRVKRGMEASEKCVCVCGKEVKKAIDKLKCGKAAGMDKINAEISK